VNEKNLEMPEIMHRSKNHIRIRVALCCLLAADNLTREEVLGQPRGTCPIGTESLLISG
jgi:hypothetical protein